jgi:hypothetical protein
MIDLAAARERLDAALLVGLARLEAGARPGQVGPTLRELEPGAPFALPLSVILGRAVALRELPALQLPAVLGLWLPPLEAWARIDARAPGLAAFTACVSAALALGADVVLAEPAGLPA